MHKFARWEKSPAGDASRKIAVTTSGRTGWQARRSASPAGIEGMVHSIPPRNLARNIMHKEANSRLDRRLLGLLATRLHELELGQVADPRKGKVIWKMRTFLAAVLTGMVAGCKSLKEMEELTAELGKGARKLLGLQRRVPDTSARDLLVALEPTEIRKKIRQSVHIARDRKQLKPDFPIRAVSVDGKYTSSWLFDDPKAPEKYGQIQNGRAQVGMITSCLVTTAARPCLDAHPIPPETNEIGAFQGAVDALLAAYGRTLFDLVMYDSGACSLENATDIKDKGLDYLFCVRNIQPTLLAEARRLLAGLAPSRCVAQTVDLVSGEVVTRRMYLTDKMKGWLDWKHLATALREFAGRQRRFGG